MQLPALSTRWSELRSRGREGQRSVARLHFNQWKSFGLSEIRHRNNKICIAAGRVRSDVEQTPKRRCSLELDNWDALCQLDGAFNVLFISSLSFLVGLCFVRVKFRMVVWGMSPKHPLDLHRRAAARLQPLRLFLLVRHVFIKCCSLRTLLERESKRWRISKRAKMKKTASRRSLRKFHHALIKRPRAQLGVFGSG